MSEMIYQVIVQRRTIAGTVQLNFKNADRANHLFAALGTLTERKVFTDDFGTKVNFDPPDIGHVVLIDAGRALEMQDEIALLQHRQRQVSWFPTRCTIDPRQG